MPQIKSVAVIGAGPSGISTVRALAQEGVFGTIRIFDRRDRIGGTWVFDERPDVFPTLNDRDKDEIPKRLPAVTPREPEDPTFRTGLYRTLDSNVGADVMAFTHTPFPRKNSAASINRYGQDNPTRPWKSIADYLEDIFLPYLHLIALNTNVESIQKKNGRWELTLKRAGVIHKGVEQTYWWKESFDAVVAATGHYNVAQIPAIEGLEEISQINLSTRKLSARRQWEAADLVDDLHRIVKGPLFLSQRGSNEALEKAFNLPNIIRKPTIKRFLPDQNGTIEFVDGSKVHGFDKVIFGTGYKLSYPFFPFEAVTSQNRLQEFYQHVFRIGEPTLAVVGQVKAAISFRVYEYQAVAVARFLAGRSKQLPSVEEQRDWEAKRLKYKGPTNSFHEVKPDFKEYFDWLRDFAGPPAPGTEGDELPPWDDNWALLGFKVLQLKDAYWSRHGGAPPAPISKAKL